MGTHPQPTIGASGLAPEPNDATRPRWRPGLNAVGRSLACASVATAPNRWAGTLSSTLWFWPAASCDPRKKMSSDAEALRAERRTRNRRRRRLNALTACRYAKAQTDHKARAALEMQKTHAGRRPAVFPQRQKTLNEGKGQMDEVAAQDRLICTWTRIHRVSGI